MEVREACEKYMSNHQRYKPDIDMGLLTYYVTSIIEDNYNCLSGARELLIYDIGMSVYCIDNELDAGFELRHMVEEIIDEIKKQEHVK